MDPGALFSRPDQLVVIGAVNGVIYGMIALGIVLVHRGTRTVNFALGETGTLSLYAAWWLVTDQGLPWVVGAAGAVTVAAAVAVGFERAVVRTMVRPSPTTTAVATIGLLTLVLAVELRAFSASPRLLPPPVSGRGVTVAGIVVSPTQLVSVVALVAASVGLGRLLRRTDFGLGVLATATDPEAARLMGVPVDRVRTFVWATGAALASVAALLMVPTIGTFAPGFATLLFVKGLVAAVIGGLDRLGGAPAGGLAVGVLEVATNRVFAASSVPNASLVGLAVVVLVVLAVRPAGLLPAPRTRGVT